MPPTVNAKKSKWADEDEEEEIVQTKTNSKSRSKIFKFRVPLRAKERRNLPRFGEAKVGEENVTLPSKDFIGMEHPDDQITGDAEDPTLAKTLANFISKQNETRLARQHDLLPSDDEAPAKPEPETTEKKADKYVAPGARPGATASSSSSAFDKDGTENTLRVSNLTKAVTEEDLRDLFERFGRIHRISLPRIEDKTGEKIPRGFAYIAFARREDAEEAMTRLQGHGYDHLIIKIEWAKPNKDGTGGGGGGGASKGMSSSFYSGYGKQLAQDTTEKAVFTSTR